MRLRSRGSGPVPMPSNVGLRAGTDVSTSTLGRSPLPSRSLLTLKELLRNRHELDERALSKRSGSLFSPTRSLSIAPVHHILASMATLSPLAAAA